MSDENGNTKPGAIRGRLWPLFMVGFLVVWIGMACSIKTYALSLDGREVMACRLWTFYFIELRRAMIDTGAISPATGSTSALLVTALQHHLVAATGGATAIGAAWLARTLQRRRRT